MAGLRGGDRHGDGFQVAHLADDDDVRVLAQAGAQGARERLRVPADLALDDMAEVRLVED